VKKSIQFFFTSFRRKPESSVFKVLRTYWTPVFTGVTAENQFFHSFGEGKGGGQYANLFIAFVLACLSTGKRTAKVKGKKKYCFPTQIK